MKLFNTLTKKLDNFEPLDRKTARIYTCGPTVYNSAHIGNLSSYIFADILRRATKSANFKTKHVMNLTDIDDKTIRNSQAKFPDLAPMNALTNLTRYYEEIFLRELNQIGCDTNSIQFVRATENIEEIQTLIIKLLRQKIAYLSDDGIYFSISEYQKTRKYGQLSRIELPSETRSRIDNDEYDKDSAQDFALWKLQKNDEPAWDFETLTEITNAHDGFSNGARKNFRGRPGWHIECSAMSVKNLGQPFDIHTGGVDLIFPHHENEIAQSTAGDQPESLARFFVHNEHLLVNGKKMSKSENNFYTLSDIRDRGFSPLDFRMLVLQSHYRSATNFSWENLEAAKNRRQNWQNIAELRWQIEDSNDKNQDKIIDNLLNEAREFLLNDLNTPQVLAKLDEAFDRFSAKHFSFSAIKNLLNFVDNNLGLNLTKTAFDISIQEKNLIKEREIARDNKNWEKSDQIRDELKMRNIALNDANEKTLWMRI